MASKSPGRSPAAGGVLLLSCAALALGWANSPWVDTYVRLWHTPLGLRIATTTPTLEWVVNDGLMVIFFFVVGLEIRHEIHAGELSEWRRAALPAAAALGGMVVPAALYLLLAGGGLARSGWGVPMATDIAFAVGVLTLLGKRVPAPLRVLLLALAVLDDLGAIVIIAVFYASGLHAWGFVVAAVGLSTVLLLQRLRVRSKLAYVLPALLTWAGVYAAGVHPTLAGVALGLLTPVQAWPERGGSLPADAGSPAQSLLQSLEPWVAFGIMPIFALANAGVSLAGSTFDATGFRVMLSVMLGLAVGKPLGVLAASWLSVRLGLARLPAGVTWWHIVVLGAVAGVGFTMALFIAQLAFSAPHLLDAAKIGVLSGTGAAAVLALLFGRALLSASHRAVTSDRSPAGTH